MSRSVVILEDMGYADLLPLTYTRPACRLRCGITTLAEKIASTYRSAAKIVIHTRPYLAQATAEESRGFAVNEPPGHAALLVNGRLIAPATLAASVPLDGDDCAYVCDGQVVAARVSGSRCAEISRLLASGPLPDGWADGLAQRTIEAPLVRYPWDLVGRNAGQITADFERLGLAARINGSVHQSAVLHSPDHIHVADGAVIQAGAILLAEGGPIFIGPGAKVMAGAVLEGPVCVGTGSSIKILAKIYEGTSIGEYCKVGGEVEECIFQGYSNKAHDGFLGHSFLGEWINLGADTNNSDLKNNYGTVKVTINGKQVDSGHIFVGSIIGDHSKTGINSMLNTGTVIGVGCNLYGGDFPPKYVPSFYWGGSGGFVEHELDKFLATAERVMARRKRALTPATRSMLSKVFELTAAERKGSPALPSGVL